MNWKFLLIGTGVFSTFFISIAMIALYYDDSAYVNMPYVVDGGNPGNILI